MTRYTRVRLIPLGPFHFGGRGVGMEYTGIGLLADSLFSALCVTIAEVAGVSEVEKLLARFPIRESASQPPFRLTSLMPYAANVYFLPYPVIAPPNVPGATDLRKRKRFKNIQWVSEVVFRALAIGKRPSDALDDRDRPITIHGGKVWLAQAEKDQLADFIARDPETNAVQAPVLWRTDRRPRVTVDRQTSASTVYGTGTTQFNRAGDLRAGLYTVIEWLVNDADLRALVQKTFEQLGAAGIGGERSSGYGQFEPEFTDLKTWSIGAPDGSYFATLSPYHPRESEKVVIGPGARYNIVLRRGWLSLPGYQNLRRASARMIADGSVLCWPGDVKSLGDLVNVTPAPLQRENSPTIYRYGLAFPVRIADAAMLSSRIRGGAGSGGGQ